MVLVVVEAGRGRGQFRGRGRGSPILGAIDFVDDSDGHSLAGRSRPDRGRSDRGHRRGRGQRRGRGHGYALDMPHAAVGAPHHQRTQFRGKKRYPTVVGPSHAESLSWIQELKSLSSDDLVDAVENDLKTFQAFLNYDRKVDLKELSTVITILLQLSRCSMDKKEAANRVLAECISDRCEPFHLQLLHSVQQVALKGKHSINYVVLLVDLCCAMLDQFHYDAMAVLPVMDIQREVQSLVKEYPTEAKLKGAKEELQIRIDQISTTVIDSGESTAAHGLSHEEEAEEIYTFSTTSILPDSDELRLHDVPKLTPNIIEGRYKSWDHYYNTQFHLLREDFVAPLRQGICDYVNGLRGRDLQDVRVYSGVRILQPEFDFQGVSYRIQFSIERLKQVNWNRTKRLIYGALVCLSNDGFTSNIVFASIANREPKELARGVVHIKPEGDSAFLPWNLYQGYTMVESSAYYEAYRHILSSLQNAEVDTMPFKQYLVDVDCEEVGQPTYLNHQGKPSVYDLSSALNCKCTTVELTRDDSWPKASSTQLDSSQLNAMKMALTQDVALIQGPPGTGKTYMGIKIVEALVHNRSVWDPTGTSPILVVCFTNHALDQFLNGIRLIKVVQARTPFGIFEEAQPISIARVGGRADDSMVEYALRNIRRGTLPRDDFIALMERKDDLKEEARSLTIGEHCVSTKVMSLQDLSVVIPHEQYLQILSICEPSPRDPHNLQLLVWLGLHELIPPENTEEKGDAPKSMELDLVKNTHSVRDEIEGSGDVEHQTETDEQDDDTGQDQISGPNLSSKESESEDAAAFMNSSGMHQRALLELPDSTFSKEAGADDLLEAGYGTLTENEVDTMDDDNLVDVEDEIAFEQERRRLYMGDEEDMMLPKLFDSDIVFRGGYGPVQPVVAEPVHSVDLLTSRPVVAEPVHSVDLSTSRPVEDCKRKNQLLLQCSPMKEAEACKISDVLKLTEKKRWHLYKYWVECLKDKKFHWWFEQFNDACREYRDMDQQQDRHALERVHVIGMTTTGAAKYQHVLHMVKPKIVIVEEAAEVLESHIVSCLTASTQHLILIGDHKQLRPKPNMYDLAKKYNLDISLFERLVRNNFPRVTLEIQHRMRPEIAELVHPLIYPVLENHVSVCGYENVKGVSSNMFFVDHCELEKPNDELRSHSNIHEAKFLAAFCRYLIRQEYQPEQITVLCAYTGQLFEVRKHMPRAEFYGVKMRTLDNYQGEENDIVLLSLVRSNTAKSIGFLRAEHRVCVALSRAKMGFYCIGNFQLLRKEGEIWEKLIPILEKKKLIGPVLRLRCENHPDKVTETKAAEDFSKVPEGGCSLDCGIRLDCGHSCVLKCHSYDRKHVEYKCPKMCPHVCQVGHACLYPCHYPKLCPPCEEQVEKVIPSCGHTLFMPCYQDPEDKDVQCKTLVDVSCEKGHHLRKECRNRDDPCEEPVLTILPKCGHLQTIKCHENADLVDCKSPCERLLACKHQCDKACGQKCTTVCHKQVDKARFCGHTLKVMCYQEVHTLICPETCDKLLRCGHKCTKKCGEPCEERCKEKVKIKLDCGHSYSKKCSSTKDPFCHVEVKRDLLCQHSAIMQCGQDPAVFKCQKEVHHTLSCGHKKKLICSQIATYHCAELVTIKRPCGHPVKRNCADESELPPCQYMCQQILACGHPCAGTCGTCFAGRLHMVCSQSITIVLPCGHFIDMRCNEQYQKYHCKAKCEFSCHHRVCQKGKVPCDGVRCPSLDCSQPCSWSCPHVRCDKKCKEPCGVPPCNEPCPKPLRCKHPCEGLCGETCPTICRQCRKKSKKKSKAQAQMGHPMTKDESCRFIQLQCSHVYEVSHLDRYMHGDDSPREKKVGIKVCLKCHKPIYGIHRYHDITQKTMQLLQLIEDERRPLGWQRPVPRFLSAAQLSLIKKIAHNPNEDSRLHGSQQLPKLELPHREAVTSVFSSQQCKFMRQIIGLVNRILDDLKNPAIESHGILMKLVGTDLVTEVLTSFYHLNVFQWPGTPQGVHDWVKEIIRMQLMLDLFTCKLILNSGRKEMPLTVLNQLQKTLCEPPRTKGGAAGGALSLHSLQQVERKLTDLHSTHRISSIADIKLPLFSSTEWYECKRGHLYCKFTRQDIKIDLFHHLQDGCPVCSKVQLEHHCTIVPK